MTAFYFVLVSGVNLCYSFDMSVKNFAVVYNHSIGRSVEVKDELYKLLQGKSYEPLIMNIDSMKGCPDFVFVIGGDGTILKAARHFAGSNTLIFGINLGRLGFLSQSSECNLVPALEKILAGNYKVEKRIMLQYNDSTALNDFVVKSSLSGRTSRFSLKINGNRLCDYLADGIIISTPTGSTAYGLSAGGPIVNPALGVFVIVPICPHTLSARPIVVPDTEKITVCEIQEKTKYFVSADGQEFTETDKEINIHKSEKEVQLVLLEDTDFYSVLKNKLHWGISPAKM